MSKVIDFVSYNGWGHAIHGNTMSDIKDYGSWLSRFWDKRKNITRKSVMVHSSVSPKVGDMVHYKVTNGVREAEIYDLEQCRDPRDMYTLYLILRPQYEVSSPDTRKEK